MLDFNVQKGVGRISSLHTIHYNAVSIIHHSCSLIRAESASLKSSNILSG